MDNFRITQHKGFQITFPNGVTVSVQFGPGSFCSRGGVHIARDYSAPEKAYLWESPNAEVAVFQAGGIGERWLTPLWPGNLDGKDVIGHQSPIQVLELLNWAAKYKEVNNAETTAKDMR